ncbi:MAG: hypothetical protein ACOH12_08990 [Parvibaculaceae bacterium]
MKFHTKTSFAALAMVGTLLTAAHAGEAPAVSKINGSLSLSGIYHNQENSSEGVGGMLSGSLSVPVTHSFGFQADTMLATNDDDGAAGIGGHLFWRDPAKGLIGITGAYVTAPNVAGLVDLSVTRFGGESEFYLGNLTLAFSGGYQDGRNVSDGSYGTAKASWYASDNLRLGIGASHDPVSDTTAIADVEYQPEFGVQSGMTFFAGTSLGKNDLVVGQAGIRFYFGDPKSLKRRNREDDPASLTDETWKQINPSAYAAYCAGKNPHAKYPGVTCGYTPPPI